MDTNLEQLKKNIGFKTAFMATLGFYVAQFVATIAGLIVLFGVFGLLYILSK